MAPPFQQHLYVVRRFRVSFLRRQPTHAWSQASVNVKLQTRSWMRPRQIDRARRNQESLVHKMQNPPCQTCWKVRSKIQRPILPNSPREIDAGIFFRRRELDVWIGLIVAQHHIEFWQVLLDQIVLERQRLAFVIHYDRFDLRNFARQRACLRVNPSRLQKIRAHPIAQQSRLANVNDLPARIAEQIHPGLLR